eukprot:14432413-Alexandrium_andersonii.AAC.1
MLSGRGPRRRAPVRGGRLLSDGLFVCLCRRGRASGLVWSRRRRCGKVPGSEAVVAPISATAVRLMTDGAIPAGTGQ